MVSSILSTYTSIQMSHTAVILSVKRDDNSMRRLNHKSSLSQGQNCYTKWGLCVLLSKNLKNLDRSPLLSFTRPRSLP